MQRLGCAGDLLGRPLAGSNSLFRFGRRLFVYFVDIRARDWLELQRGVFGRFGVGIGLWLNTLFGRVSWRFDGLYRFGLLPLDLRLCLGLLHFRGLWRRWHRWEWDLLRDQRFTVLLRIGRSDVRIAATAREGIIDQPGRHGLEGGQAEGFVV